MKKFFCYIILACMFLMLVACGKPSSQKTFENFFKEFQTDLIKREEKSVEPFKTILKIYEKTTYKINKVEEKGENSELNVTIKAINLDKYVNEYIAAVTKKYGENIPADKQEEFNKFSVEYFTNILNDKNVEYVENDVNVKMQKVEGEWKITNPNELVSAILGGAGNLIGL